MIRLSDLTIAMLPIDVATVSSSHSSVPEPDSQRTATICRLTSTQSSKPAATPATSAPTASASPRSYAEAGDWQRAPPLETPPVSSSWPPGRSDAPHRINLVGLRRSLGSLVLMLHWYSARVFQGYDNLRTPDLAVSPPSDLARVDCVPLFTNRSAKAAPSVAALGRG